MEGVDVESNPQKVDKKMTNSTVLLCSFSLFQLIVLVLWAATFSALVRSHYSHSAKRPRPSQHQTSDEVSLLHSSIAEYLAAKVAHLRGVGWDQNRAKRKTETHL